MQFQKQDAAELSSSRQGNNNSNSNSSNDNSDSQNSSKQQQQTQQQQQQTLNYSEKLCRQVSHPFEQKLLADNMENNVSQNVLDFSPFKFIEGISARRLLKGRSLLGRTNLYDALKCTFCNKVIVQGQECNRCEGNFCSPCIKQWQASESAKVYTTPCKCPEHAQLKQLNKLKQEYLNQIRFRCNNHKCTYQLTYDELLLGTHELDDCSYMNIVCEGCSMRILKQDRIRHESIECESPLARCQFCTNVFSISDMLAHRRECGQRSIIKVEYPVNNPCLADGVGANSSGSISSSQQQASQKNNCMQTRNSRSSTSQRDVELVVQDSKMVVSRSSSENDEIMEEQGEQQSETSKQQQQLLQHQQQQQEDAIMLDDDDEEDEDYQELMEVIDEDYGDQQQHNYDQIKFAQDVIVQAPNSQKDNEHHEAADYQDVIANQQGDNDNFNNNNKNHQDTKPTKPQQQQMIYLCEFCSIRLKGPFDDSHQCKKKQTTNKPEVQQDQCSVAVVDQRRVQQQRPLTLGFVSQTADQTCQQESSKPATQSTSRKAKNSSTGQVQSQQSSGHQQQTSKPLHHSSTTPALVAATVPDEIAAVVGAANDAVGTTANMGGCSAPQRRAARNSTSQGALTSNNKKKNNSISSYPLVLQNENHQQQQAEVAPVVDADNDDDKCKYSSSTQQQQLLLVEESESKALFFTKENQDTEQLQHEADHSSGSANAAAAVVFATTQPTKHKLQRRSRSRVIFDYPQGQNIETKDKQYSTVVPQAPASQPQLSSSTKQNMKGNINNSGFSNNNTTKLKSPYRVESKSQRSVQEDKFRKALAEQKAEKEKQLLKNCGSVASGKKKSKKLQQVVTVANLTAQTNYDINKKVGQLSRLGLNQEESFREAFQEAKQKKQEQLSQLQHQQMLVSNQKVDNNNSVAVSAVQVSGELDSQSPVVTMNKAKVSKYYIGQKTLKTKMLVVGTAAASNGITSGGGFDHRSHSRYSNGQQQKQTQHTHHISAGNHHHRMNPRKISVQNKRLTRQQSKKGGVENKHQTSVSFFEKEDATSSCLEYDLESRHMEEKTFSQQRSRELEQIIQAQSQQSQAQQQQQLQSSSCSKNIVPLEKRSENKSLNKQDQQLDNKNHLKPNLVNDSQMMILQQNATNSEDNIVAHFVENSSGSKVLNQIEKNDIDKDVVYEETISEQIEQISETEDALVATNSKFKNQRQQASSALVSLSQSQQQRGRSQQQELLQKTSKKNSNAMLEKRYFKNSDKAKKVLRVLQQMNPSSSQQSKGVVVAYRDSAAVNAVLSLPSSQSLNNVNLNGINGSNGGGIGNGHAFINRKLQSSIEFLNKNKKVVKQQQPPQGPPQGNNTGNLSKQQNGNKRQP